VQDACTAATDTPDVPFARLVSARLVARPNRFLAEVELDGQRVAAACLDPGRLERILVPGAELLLAPAAATPRRTAYTLALVRDGRVWIGLRPALASRIVQFALARRAIAELAGARVVRTEVRCGTSRIDFLLAHGGKTLLLEVKSCGAVVDDGRALFPDCPTERGTRHVETLLAARRRGQRAALVFVAQRPDVEAFAPYESVDPAFARALRRARRGGVRLLAYACRVDRRGLRLDRAIRVEA
jgi:sugar fermentation stimulation protein A